MPSVSLRAEFRRERPVQERVQSARAEHDKPPACNASTRRFTFRGVGELSLCLY